jgi:catechol 2,3-dioxygenase-like lactoylglutathione lyase family enzyme
MELVRIEHINLSVPEPQLAESVAFYQDVLGLTHGERPPFQNPGAWLYLDGHPLVHLSCRPPASPEGSGVIDHIAFKGKDPDAYITAFDKNCVKYEKRRVPDEQMLQLFLYDPSGVQIELIFEVEGDLSNVKQL